MNDKNELLLIKRESKDPHCPGAWEIPGGRLELGENPFEGLKRETKEETGLDIRILNPLRVRHFTRDDGQKITLISFLCKPISSSITLSEEHVAYSWTSIEDAKLKLHPGFYLDVDLFEKHFRRA